MTGFDSKRQAAQDKMEFADAYASAVAATPHMPTPLERKLAVERIERARNALKAALEQQAEPTCPDCKAAVLYECVACSSNNYPPKQQVAPPQRKELAASEILNMMPSGIPAEYDGELMEFARAVEAKLKEKNND